MVAGIRILLDGLRGFWVFIVIFENSRGNWNLLGVLRGFGGFHWLLEISFLRGNAVAERKDL